MGIQKTKKPLYFYRAVSILNYLSNMLLHHSRHSAPTGIAGSALLISVITHSVVRSIPFSSGNFSGLGHFILVRYLIQRPQSRHYFVADVLILEYALVQISG